MATDFFADIPTIAYEGPDSDNELAYRFYDKNRVVLGKTMEEHLRFAACFWHTFCWPGSDVFGGGTFNRPRMPARTTVRPPRRSGKWRSTSSRSSTSPITVSTTST